MKINKNSKVLKGVSYDDLRGIDMPTMTFKDEASACDPGDIYYKGGKMYVIDNKGDTIELADTSQCIDQSDATKIASYLGGIHDDVVNNNYILDKSCAVLDKSCENIAHTCAKTDVCASKDPRDYLADDRCWH